MNKFNRLDVRKCSDEGVKRLIDAIFNQTIKDWNISAKNINKKGNDDSNMYVLKQIIDFIQSDLFAIYSNGKCPQREYINKLLNKIVNKQAKEDLTNYSLINEKKWFNVERNNNQLTIFK